MTFAEADRIYAGLKQQYVAGALTADQFDEQLHALMVQDDLGRWWAKSRESGNWHYYDAVAEDWVAAQPPGAPAAPAVAPAATQPQARRAAAPQPEPVRQEELRTQATQAPQQAPQQAPEQVRRTTGSAVESASGQGALPKWAAVAPGGDPVANPAQPAPPEAASSAEPAQPGAVGGYSIRDFAPIPELSGGVKLVLYLLALIIPLAGILLFFLYRNKPAQPDRNAARAFLILGVLSLVFTCLCSSTFLLLEATLFGTQPA